MDTVTQKKNERINLRLKRTAKRLIELAAGFEGKTVSHFILDSALARAEQTVRQHEAMTLNAQDAEAFFDALSASVKFNRKLTAALEEHDKHVTGK